MAGSDMKKQVLNLIHDFASENSQKERRVVDLKKQIKEHESELDATNVELEEANRSKETAEQELNEFQLQLALNDAAIQPLESRISLMQDEISAVGSDVQALKQRQDKKKTKKKNKNKKKKKKKKKNKNSQTSKEPEDAEATDDSSSEYSDRPSNNGGVEGQDMQKEPPAKAGALEAPVAILESPAPSTEAAFSSGAPSTDATTLSQLSVMQDMLDQLIHMQKEMQSQMNALVSDLINKEGKRLEASLGWSMEKAVKSNTEALWTCFQEENVIHEKLNRDCTQQITDLITNFINKDLPQMEIAAIGPSIARAISPALEKSTSNAIIDSFQKGVGEKAVNQLEKSVVSKLEATVARQIQAQFRNSGKQALQDALRSKLESSIIPAFDMSCKAMFEQIDAAFQKGLLNHTTAAQQQLKSSHSSLAIALRDAINSASSITQTLTGALTRVEAFLDPKTELSRLIAERKYEEAFTRALCRSDVKIVSWLCSQVDLWGILPMSPLSQGVLLPLLWLLACDISSETTRKVEWMTAVAVAINPGDSMIAMQILPVFKEVNQMLRNWQDLPTTSPSEVHKILVLVHVMNEVCKNL